MKTFTALLLALTFFVIGLGAYTRLMDAGLGCPDWPGCYGHWVLPSLSDLQESLGSFDHSQELKAWIEMIHRYVAGFLGSLMITLGMILFLKGRSPWLGLMLIMLTVLQAALGMWTVTHQLNPIIVSLHLIGGIGLFLSLISLLAREFHHSHAQAPKRSESVLLDLVVSFYLLQIFLGAWVSTNYAALSCQGLLSCHLDNHVHWPSFSSLFDFLGIWQSSEPLAFFSLEEKAHIQLIHRSNAVILGGLIALLHYYYRPIATMKHRPWLDLMVFLYLLQMSVGLLLIVLQLPLPLAVAHNLLAVMLGVPIFWLKFQSQRAHVS